MTPQQITTGPGANVPGPADVASSLPLPVAAGILRRIADAIENDTTPCGRAAATGEPCPVHEADRHPADGDPRPHPNPFAVDPEQVERAQQQLGEAFAAFGRKLRAERAEQAPARTPEPPAPQENQQ